MIHPIFKNVDLNIHENWKLGLVGRNGRGKTTFFHLLLNELEHEGSIQSSLRFKYFPSLPSEDEKMLTLDVLLQHNPHIEVWEIEKELAGMDLSSEILYKHFHQLSGGEQTKVLLIELFLNEEVFPLIDEPTNNLDLKGRKIVGEYLKNKRGFIVASHDEAFLNQCISHVLAINKNSIDLISGNIDTWKYEKTNADLLAEETNQQLKTEIKRLNTVSRRVNDWGNRRENSTKDASERRMAAKQMKRAKAIQKRTEGLMKEKQNLIQNVEKTSELKMVISKPRNQLLFFRDFTIMRDNRPLFQPISLDMYPEDRLFIEGENGAGKSTFLKFILGMENLEVRGEYNICLPEHLSVLHQKNNENQDYLSMLRKLSTKADKEEYWHILHQLGIERSKFTNQISATWSAGQQKKTFLANALLGKNELFVWDEVTNYLDLTVIHQLIQAIHTYKPSMIGIDHNEVYVNAVATKKIMLLPSER